MLALPVFTILALIFIESVTANTGTHPLGTFLKDSSANDIKAQQQVADLCLLVLLLFMHQMMLAYIRIYLVTDVL